MTEASNDETAIKDAKKPKRLSGFQKYLIVFAVGLVLAAVLTTGLRFALAKDTSVHYHANFALYINGKQDEFKSFTFYEEVAACNSHDADNPKVRVHLHDNKPHLVHVHAGGVTWGQFFENLGYTLGDNLISTDNGVYITGDDGNKLTFTLNGKKTDAIANKLISSEDVLLINYGKDDDSMLTQRYDNIPRDAGTANSTKDPSACSGGHEFTFWNRLKQALGFSEASH